MSEQGWKLLDRALDAEAIDEATRYIAREKHDEHHGTQPFVIFRTGPELVALPAIVFDEITEMRPIHTLPHRLSDVVLGLTNVRGELVVCVSLARLVGIDMTDQAYTPHAARRRLIIIRSEGNRIVFPADEVYGTYRFRPEDAKEVPATVAKATANYTRAMLPWRGSSVGLLDDQLIFYTVNRSLA